MKKEIIHYTDGYGGNYEYKTYCKKRIHSHSEIASATIDPMEVNCKKCMQSKEFIEDLADKQEDRPNTKRRIYLESDILHASELMDAQREVSELCKTKNATFVRRVFSDVIDHSWHELNKTWEAVKRADEIYSNSSLLPLSGGSYMGAPVIFNEMCKRAAEEGLSGKEVYILRPLKDINWYMIKLELFDAAFKKNYLYTYNEEYELTQVDIDEVIRNQKKQRR